MIYAIVILSILFIVSAIANFNKGDDIRDLKDEHFRLYDEREELRNKLKEKERLLKELRDKLTASS